MSRRCKVSITVASSENMDIEPKPQTQKVRMPSYIAHISLRFIVTRCDGSNQFLCERPSIFSQIFFDIIIDRCGVRGMACWGKGGKRTRSAPAEYDLLSDRWLGGRDEVWGWIEISIVKDGGWKSYKHFGMHPLSSSRLGSCFGSGLPA